MATTFLRRASAWLLTLSLTGCTVSFHPMGWGKPPHNDHVTADWYGQNPLPPGVNPATANRPPGFQPNMSAHDLAGLYEKMRLADDERRFLTGKVQQADYQNREKDQALELATKEMQEAARVLRRYREEGQISKQQFDDLQNRLRNVERENRQTLESLVKTLESYLGDRGPSSGTLRH